jgi:hypothetical protein
MYDSVILRENALDHRRFLARTELRGCGTMLGEEVHVRRRENSDSRKPGQRNAGRRIQEIEETQESPPLQWDKLHDALASFSIQLQRDFIFKQRWYLRYRRELIGANVAAANVRFDARPLIYADLVFNV